MGHGRLEGLWVVTEVVCDLFPGPTDQGWPPGRVGERPAVHPGLVGMDADAQQPPHLPEHSLGGWSSRTVVTLPREPELIFLALFFFPKPGLEPRVLSLGRSSTSPDLDIFYFEQGPAELLRTSLSRPGRPQTCDPPVLASGVSPPCSLPQPLKQM